MVDQARRPSNSTDGHLCLGLISGTSADGIDAALVRIDGAGARIELIAFRSTPYPAKVRAEGDELNPRPGPINPHQGGIDAIGRGAGD